MTRDKDAFRTPTNTAAADPRGHLLDALAGGSSAMIERMEARGQRELVEATVLPADGSHDPLWAKIGVVFGDPVVGDPIFRKVTLPDGWKKRATDHAMWSELLDAKGRVRARIFYKAAFYDRSANLQPVRRFEVSYEPQGGWGSNLDAAFGIIKDNGIEIWRSPVAFTEVGTRADRSTFKTDDQVAREAAAAALVEMGYPEWRDHAAYWD